MSTKRNDLELERRQQCQRQGSAENGLHPPRSRERLPERKRKMQGVYDWHRSALKACHGKDGKDRVIPVGQQALPWAAARSNPWASNSSGDCAGVDNFGNGLD